MKAEHAYEMHAPDAEADGKRPGNQPKRSHPVVPKPPESAREIEPDERRHRGHDDRQQDQPIAVRSSHDFLYTTKRGLVEQYRVVSASLLYARKGDGN